MLASMRSPVLTMSSNGMLRSKTISAPTLLRLRFIQAITTGMMSCFTPSFFRSRDFFDVNRFAKRRIRWWAPKL